MKPENVLSIEAAIGGGSIALLADTRLAGRWHAESGASRSEELLSQIAGLLERSGYNRKDLTRIAVSNGPGSYTGIRGGLATAMGLARALEIPCVGVSLLRAIANCSEIRAERIAVVPIGRNGYCWQRFEKSSGSEGETATGSGNLEELVMYLTEYPTAKVLAQSDAFQTLIAHGPTRIPSERIVDLGRYLAVAVGLASADTDDGLRPFYARDATASPTPGASI